MSPDIAFNKLIIEVLGISEEPLSVSQIVDAVEALFRIKQPRTREQIIRDALTASGTHVLGLGCSYMYYHFQAERDLAVLKQMGFVWEHLYKFQLTASGIEVYERMRKHRHQRSNRTDQSLVFVASAIGYADVDAVFSECFTPACRKFNCNPVRIDLEEPWGTITDAILAMVDQARLVIADLTYARQSVYFEVGFAMGLGVQMILTCRRDHQNGQNDETRIHFDLAQFKISFWDRKDNSIVWPSGMDPESRLRNVLR